MSYDGSHLICKEHKEARVYCTIDKGWVCLSCELEKRPNQSKSSS